MNNRIMTNEEIAELRLLYIELGKIVKKYGQRYYFYQLKIILDVIACIDFDMSNEEKTDHLIYYYRILFPARGGLTEFYIHYDDYETRRRMNKPLDDIEDKLRKIMKPYMQI